MNDMTFSVRGDGESIARLNQILAIQKAAQLRDGIPSAEVRINRLDRCIGLLVDHAEQIADALSEDFSCRARETSLITDVASSLGPLKDAKSHLTKGRSPLSAKGRRWHHRTLEFPGKSDLCPARPDFGRWQSCHDQTIRIDACNF